MTKSSVHLQLMYDKLKVYGESTTNDNMTRFAQIIDEVRTLERIASLLATVTIV